MGAMLSAPSAFVVGGAQEGKFLSVFLPMITAVVGFWATLSLNISVRTQPRAFLRLGEENIHQGGKKGCVDLFGTRLFSSFRRDALRIVRLVLFHWCIFKNAF